MMGLHWVDPESPELKGNPFTKTFIYGSFDGKMIFWEQMITKAFIEGVKTAPNATVASEIKVPSIYERPGYYPTRYAISWDAGAKEYRIALDALVQQK